MESLKVIYVKCDDSELLLEKLKKIMEDYDMYLIGINENKYTFDRDKSYSRSFIIDTAMNGWITITDEDDTKTEEMSMDLSDSLVCFTLCIGMLKDVLYYTAYEDGEQTGQFMSSLKYYEYQINDIVVNTFKGEAVVFKALLETEEVESLQVMLDECREGIIEPWKLFNTMRRMLGVISEQNDEDEGEDEDGREEEDSVEITELFYVDFESINIKTDDRDKILDALIQITNNLKFKATDDFKSSDGQKKSFFKKVISSVSESKRLKFFISPLSEGWVTIVCEVEKLVGNSPESWEFLHVENTLSNITKERVFNIFADNESWGFALFEDGREVYGYSSKNESVELDIILNLFPEADNNVITDIFARTLLNAEDVDRAFAEFCAMLGIRNYRINIPMDYTEDEFKESVIDKLPDGQDFLNLKFIEDK